MQYATSDRRDSAETTSGKTARLVNPASKVVRAFLYVAFALVTCPAVLFAVSPQAGFIGVLLGGILAFSMLLAALITALVGLSISRRLKRFQKGEFLVHWTYTPDEWQAYAESELEHKRRDARKGPVIGLAIGGISGLVMGGACAYGFFHDVGATVLGVAAGGLLVGLLGAAVGYLGGAVGRLIARRNYEWMRGRDGVTYIGADAAYCEGLYWSWTMPNTRLVHVALVEGSPSVLEFTVSVHMPKGGTALYKHRAPVPAGREDEALRVVERLTRR